MGDKVRWGVLGCGYVTKDLFLPGLVNAPNCQLYAVAGKSPEKLAAVKEKFSPQVCYDNYEDLLNDPLVEVVYIGLPNNLHLEWAVKAARQKKHVLCEKPLALTAGEAQQMIDAANENGVLLEEAFAYLHGSVMEKVDEIIASGVLGKITHVDVRFHNRLLNRTDIRLDPQVGGGVVLDMGCYTVSFIRHVLGREPTAVSALITMGAETGVDESALVSLNFAEEGATAGSYVSLNSRIDCSRTIVGEEGVLIIPLVFNAIGEKSIILKKTKGVEEIPLTCIDPYQEEARQFASCIRDGKKPRVTNEFSMGNAIVLEKILACK